jgi:hypothetical protein
MPKPQLKEIKQRLNLSFMSESDDDDENIIKEHSNESEDEEDMQIKVHSNEENKLNMDDF